MLFRVSIFGYNEYLARKQGRGHDRFRRHGFRDAHQKGSRFQNHRFRDAKRKFPRIFERFVADAARARVKQVRIECPLCARSGTCLHHAMLVCWEQVKDVHRAYASATPSRTFQGIEKWLVSMFMVINQSAQQPLR